VNFSETFMRGTVLLDLKGQNKRAIIVEMIDALVTAGKLPADKRETAINAVMERERRMSTGMQSGVAIPHGKSPLLTDFVTAIGIKKDGVDFGSQDGQLCRIFVMTLSSANQVAPHMQYLAEISKRLSQPQVRQRLIDSSTEKEVIDIVTATP
jgi:mannitol/fructose-specific phosphotransferase system IIA component (Ntr-type)